jgi:class 3 adenylate cyclase
MQWNTNLCLLVLSLALAACIAVLLIANGEIKGVKINFFVVSCACALLLFGLWLESTYRKYTFLGAKLGMTAAILLAIFGSVSVRKLVGLPARGPFLWVCLGIVAIHAVMVVFSDVYFTGHILEFQWGYFVDANGYFFWNPLLVAGLAVYHVALLWRRLDSFDVLRRNKVSFIFLAYAMLAPTALDYLPHFGVAFAHGPVSRFFVPLFLVIFGYTCLRYRLVPFGELLAQALGWGVLLLMIGTAYIATSALMQDLVNNSDLVAVSAAASAILVYAMCSRVVFEWTGKLAGIGSPNYEAAEWKLAALLASASLRNDVVALARDFFQETFGTSDLAIVSIGDIPVVDGFFDVATAKSGGVDVGPLAHYEWAVPLANKSREALAIGSRSDCRMYSTQARQSIRNSGALVTAYVANVEKAEEIRYRQQLDRFLPSQMVEQVLAGAEGALREYSNREVTVLFMDLQGFTSLSETIPAQRLAGLLNEFLRAMTDVVFRHGGTLDKFIGDSVMVFFGAPVTMAPTMAVKNCVRMAVEMQKSLQSMNERWLDEGSLKSELLGRIGMHSGDAIVGAFGNDVRSDYTCIGKVVNLASRIEKVCRPGYVALSAASYSFVQTDFPTQLRGDIRVKGLSDPITIYEINPLDFD